MSNILITGCCGFIGYHLTKKLINFKNTKIIGVDSLNRYYSIKLKKDRLKKIKKKNFLFLKKDLSNKKECEEIISEHKPNIIFHLAAQPGVTYSFTNPESYIKNNILATNNIVKTIKKNNYKVKKFIFCSSSSVYGPQKEYPIKENSKLNPINPYAKTKKKCEKLIKSNFSKNKNIKDYIILRLFTVYGPYGRPDMLILKLLSALEKKKKISLYNFGNYLRDFTYIDDVVNVFIKILKKKIKNKIKIFNVCGSRPIKVLNIIKLIKKITKRNLDYNLLPRRKGEVNKTHGSNKKLKQILNLKKFTSFDDGITKTYNWYKNYKYKKNLIY